MLFIVFKMVETTFSNFQEGFSLISPKLHTHSLLNMTQILVPKSPIFEKIWGDEAVDRNKHL